MHWSSSGLLAFLGSCTLLLCGCASNLPAPDSQTCSDRYASLEDYARERGIYLSEPRFVPAYPSLGTSRLLGSFEPEKLTAVQRSDWLERLQAAGRERRGQLVALLRARGEGDSLPPALEDLESPACANPQLSVADGSSVDWQELWQAVQVEDDYLTARRVLGLYPLTSIFAGLGIQSLQKEIYARFSEPLADLPVSGRLRRYLLTPQPRPDSQARPAQAIIDDLPRDSLGLQLSPAMTPQLTALFARHAPILEIDHAGSYDAPGVPFFDAQGLAGVARDSAHAYGYASLMPFAGELRLQLNYVFWFDERPPATPLDSLSGRLDGLVWRVTLDRFGQVLLYDSIHACGCYQQFFLTDRVAARPENGALPEPPLIPQAAPTEGVTVLRVSSGAHYLQRVYSDAGADATGAGPVSDTQFYKLEDYASLYAVQGPKGLRSLFNKHGIVPGTERGERFYLWPMGIRSPGAMRERARQPTAFLGRRHFDDADLLDQLFIAVEP